MTQIYKQLNQEAAMQIINKVMQQAFVQFPNELEGCELEKYIWSTNLSIHKLWEKTETYEVGLFHKSTVTAKRSGTDYTAIRAEIQSATVEGLTARTLELTSHPISNYCDDKRDYDNVTLWIAGQLEKVFDKIVVNLNDPSKIGSAIGWRCAYCNTLNTGKACDHCGAPRAW
jgi:hypothetical protein